MDSLISEFRRCQSEASQLKSSLNRLGAEKEEWFGKVKLLRKEIVSTVEKIRELKAKRDLLTAAVHQNKPELQKLIDSTADIHSRRDFLTKERDSQLKTAGIDKSPDFLKSEIKKLEFKIETEAINFEEETRIMKVLKQKKKILAAYEKLNPLIAELRTINNASYEVDDLIRGLKLKIRADASESQRHHEAMIAAVKSLDELRAKAKEAYEKFSEMKKQFSETNRKLKEKLQELSSMKLKLDEKQISALKETADKKEKFLDEKEAELKEKMLKGKKLTTQDLLIFQGNAA